MSFSSADAHPDTLCFLKRVQHYLPVLAVNQSLPVAQLHEEIGEVRFEQCYLCGLQVIVLEVDLTAKR